MPDSDASPKVLVAHGSEAREFAETLTALLAEVLGFGALAVRRSEVEQTAGASGSPQPATELARQAPVLIAVDLSNAAEPPPPLGELLAVGGHELKVRVSTRSVTAPPQPPERLEVAGWDIEAVEDLIGRIAGALGISQTLALLPQRGRLEALRRLATARQLAAGGPWQRLARWGAALALPVAIAGGVYLWFYSDWRAGHFEFEEHAQGWRPETANNRGCVGVSQSEQRSRWGAGALALELELDPGEPGRRSGEAWVDLTKASLESDTAPLDLGDRSLRVWVYAPASAAGPEKHPHGLQLFVKDAAGSSHYGPWVNVRAETWNQLVLPVGQAQEGSRPAPGFRPDAVTVVGVKMEVGGGSAEGFSGELYIDSVDW